MKTPILENNRVKLLPLSLENYTHLIDIAKQDKLVQYSPSKIDTPKDLEIYVKTALERAEANKAMPFIIFDKEKQTYAGCTRFGHINSYNKVLYIGWTWIGREFQSTGLNMNMKFLMLQYAFETLKFDKVGFTIDERNIRSRKAVEKIGGTLEGILRNDVLMPDGFKRSTCCYSILTEEWDTIKTTIFKGF
ncbi:GNAT family N-acetyltransferase [Algibacter pectinivorans]|uniref:Protein N-acetyltransferase, RimJ/RimL family n=1 Tax=Algibacter pectinivorans TaxID=870482 RepID=A0A1I1RV59_9FLAO|nr:GNAT family protein [Algibacter pectinivorans]SFD35423.1 Protein N-acetyltransferase, RimJ/RimL family [Algibacter pectinivorans]